MDLGAITYIRDNLREKHRDIDIYVITSGLPVYHTPMLSEGPAYYYDQDTQRWIPWTGGVIDSTGMFILSQPPDDASKVYFPHWRFVVFTEDKLDIAKHLLQNMSGFGSIQEGLPVVRWFKDITRRPYSEEVTHNDGGCGKHKCVIYYEPVPGKGTNCPRADINIPVVC